MNNIRKIIEERSDNVKDEFLKSFNDITLGKCKAYQDCLNLIDEYEPKIIISPINIKEFNKRLANENEKFTTAPDNISIYATRTEQEILNDFEKLGWKVTQNDDSCMIICFNGFARIVILKCAKQYSINNLCNMQEHKLLNELFEVYGWL